MAGPTFVAVGAITDNNLTIPFPAGSTGDFLLLVWESDTGTDQAAASGWTTGGKGNLSNGHAIGCLWKNATSGSSGSQAFTGLVGSFWTCQIYRYSGVHATTPINAGGIEVDSVTAGSITTTVANCLEFAALSYDFGSASATAPTGWTRRVNGTSTENWYGADRLKATAGATGTTAFQATGGGVGMVHIALAPAAGGATDLVVADVTHAHTAEAPTLTQVHSLAVADAAHAQSVEAPTLTQVHELVVDDVVHAQTVEAPTLNVAANLTVADVTHAHSSESPTLTQVHELAVANAVHGHTVENVTLNVGAIDLVVADVTHAHTVAGVTLTTLPAAPTGLTPTAGDTEVGLTWTAPNDGGSALTNYIVQYRVTPTSDEFAGSSIDTEMWTVYDRLGDQVNNEVNAVIPANVRVGSGTLKIDSKHEDVVAGDTTTGPPNPRTVHYTSGQIAQAAPAFLYGTVDVRAKICGGTGTWPCIWMLGHEWQASQPFTANVAGADWPNDGWWEIDIAEFLSGHRTLQNCQLHFITSSRGGSGEKSIPFDATTRFMVYRLEWTATSLVWKIDAEDGVGFRTLLTITGTAGTDIPNTPGYLIIHTAIGGIGATTPDSSTFPVTTEVDYARVTAVTANDWSTFSHTASTTPSITVTGLTNDVPYDFRVAAVNAVGTGPWSDLASATPNDGAVDLIVADVTHAHTVGTPTLTQVHGLAVADVAHAHSAAAPTLTQVHALAVADVAHAQTVDGVTLTQVHELVVENVTHTQIVEDVTLSAEGDVVADPVVHAHTVDNVTLTQVHHLVVDDVLHGQTVDAVTLGVNVTLVVADVIHAHTVESPAVNTSSTLIIDDVVHAHSVATVTLTQLHVLTVADVLHAHLVDMITLGGLAEDPYADHIDWMESSVLSWAESSHLDGRSRS